MGLRLRSENCLVIGGGRVALRKINTLIQFGARITCISPEIVKELQRLSREKKIKYVKAGYFGSTGLKKYKLVIAATDNAGLNQKIGSRALKHRVLVNVVTGKTKGDIIFPAILKKKGMLISVSTNGESPSKAKRVRDRLRDYV